ncbi:MAG: alginate export family protein [Sinimarinibacterium sp.]|jgi:alginate production protein
MIRTLPATLVLSATLAAATVRAADLQPGEADFELKLRLAGFGEGPRDLGLTDDAGLPIDADGDTAEGYLDLQPTLFWRMATDWSTLIRLQGFVPSGDIVVTDEERPRSTESYAALREAWIEYGGITSYPGEVLRVGRQRLRGADGTWWDRDVESVRWIFDTTLLQFQLGSAAQLDTFRSDGSELPASQRDRAYVFADLSGQWYTGHTIGARSTYAWDYGDVGDADTLDEPDPKLSDRRYGWVGVYAHNGYYDMPDALGLYYWLQADYLAGTRDDYIVTGSPETPLLRVGRDVGAFAGDVGLRARLARGFAVGAAWAYGQGDSGGADGDGRIETYEQPGLHSNRSRFTGTHSLLYRYNEALQPDLGNLQVGSAYLSIPLERFDASFVYHRLLRNSADAPVVTDGLDVAPSTDSRDLGNGYDLVLTGYFGATPSGSTGDREDLRSNLRLRGSLFQPGDAYGEDAPDDQYRVTLELTLWLF